MEDVTILFTDIEGSTRLLERLGDGRWLDLLHQHNDIVRAHLFAHGGQEVKSQGDGFMLAFDEAGAALRCAAAIQRSLAFVRHDQAGGGLRVRIGADCGPVCCEDGDYLGLHVNLAARITGAARGGEILASASVRDHAGEDPELRWGRSRPVRLAGLSHPLRVANLEWQTAPARTRPPARFRPALAW